MQNQDPTAQTDPNSYINQLVQINSLEQLISINQNLTTALTPTTPASGNVPSSGGGISAVSPSISGSAVSTAGPAAAAETSTAHGVSERATLRNGTSNPIHGSLSVPSISSSSRSVAKSLDGHPRSTPRGHGIRDIPTRALP
jgi:flagellar basal-body rod modification protein FlgD